MLKQFEGARLGLFVFVGTALLIVSVFMLGNKEKLFVNTIQMKAYFNQIEGLKNGAPVRLSGYGIGSVSNLSLAPDTSGRVEVTLNIEKDLMHFIRLDSEASIATEGLVGKKIVAITPGSPNEPMLKDGAVIKSKDPVNIGAIIEETQEIMSNLTSLTSGLSEIVAKVNNGEGTIGKIVNDEELYNSAVQITQSADKSLNSVTGRMEEISDVMINLGKGFEDVLTNVDSVVADVKMMTRSINEGEGILNSLLNDKSMNDSVLVMLNNLVETSESVSLGASRFAENMEALKHNWLFKAYFEERGYWDKAEYREELDNKLQEIKQEQHILDQKIEELKRLKEEADYLLSASFTIILTIFIALLKLFFKKIVIIQPFHNTCCIMIFGKINSMATFKFF